MCLPNVTPETTFPLSLAAALEKSVVRGPGFLRGKLVTKKPRPRTAPFPKTTAKLWRKGASGVTDVESSAQVFLPTHKTKINLLRLYH